MHRLIYSLIFYLVQPLLCLRLLLRSLKQPEYLHQPAERYPEGWIVWFHGNQGLAQFVEHGVHLGVEER